jgi:hypothetical protein
MYLSWVLWVLLVKLLIGFLCAYREALDTYYSHIKRNNDKIEEYLMEFGNIFLTIISIFVAIALRYELNLVNTTKIMAEEFSKDTGTDYKIIQDSITDPKTNKYSLATYIAVILLIFLSGYLSAWIFSAFVAINLFLIYSLLPLFKFPKPGSKYFVNKVYNGLVNRKEGYEKINDEIRVEACQHYIMKIINKYNHLLK